MSLSDKFSKFKTAAADLARGVVDEVGDKLIPDIPPPPTTTGTLGWHPIAEAPPIVRDLARASGGGQLRFGLDLTAKDMGAGYAFWAVAGVVTHFFRIPPLGR